MILIRYALIGLIIYLIIRSFIRKGVEEELEKHRAQQNGKTTITHKVVSKDVGDFVDYDEVD